MKKHLTYTALGFKSNNIEMLFFQECIQIQNLLVRQIFTVSLAPEKVRLFLTHNGKNLIIADDHKELIINRQKVKNCPGCPSAHREDSLKVLKIGFATRKR